MTEPSYPILWWSRKIFFEGDIHKHGFLDKTCKITELVDFVVGVELCQVIEAEDELVLTTINC